MSKIKLLSVIVPAYNEENSISKTLAIVASVPPLKEIIVVNDASTDKTKLILEGLPKDINSQNYPFLKRLVVINKEVNGGKGSAIRAALPQVEGDVVLIQDADLELDPHEYPSLLEPFEKLDADAVFGSRFRREGTVRVHSTIHFLGNKFLTWVSNFFTGLYLTDMETGYKVFSQEIAKSLKIKSNRFGIDPELTAKIARMVKKKRLNFYEVSVSYMPRTRAEGKKIRAIKDGLVVLASIFYFNLFDDGKTG